MVEFGELRRDGTYIRIGSLKRSDMLKCPHTIIVFEHYRADGTCRCNDPTHTEMQTWGYRWNRTVKRWV